MGAFAKDRAVAFIVVAVLLDAVGFGIVIPVMPQLITQLGHVGLAQAAIAGGWLFFAFAVVQFFCAPLLGSVSDRVGRRPVLLLSLVAFGVDYLIMATAPTLPWLFVGRVLAGIPGGAYTTAYAYLADITPHERRAQRFGLAGAAFGIGFIVGPAIGGLLGQLGPRAPFLAAAAVAFANAAFGFLALPESLPRASRRPLELRRANPAGALLQLRKYPAVLGLAIALFLWSLAGQVYPSIWSFYTMQRFGWDVALVGASLAFVGVIMAVSQATFPRVVIARLGEPRTALLGLGVGAAGFAGYAFATQGWMLFAILTTWLFAGLVMPSVNAMMSRQVPPTAQGELQGANASLFSLAAIAGPPLMAQLFGNFSRPDAPVVFPGMAFLAASLLALASLAVLARVRPPAPSAPAPAMAADQPVVVAEVSAP